MLVRVRSVSLFSIRLKVTLIIRYIISVASPHPAPRVATRRVSVYRYLYRGFSPYRPLFHSLPRSRSLSLRRAAFLFLALVFPVSLALTRRNTRSAARTRSRARARARSHTFKKIPILGRPYFLFIDFPPVCKARTYIWPAPCYAARARARTRALRSHASKIRVYVYAIYTVGMHTRSAALTI